MATRLASPPREGSLKGHLCYYPGESRAPCLLRAGSLYQRRFMRASVPAS